ncbi:MAG: Rpn family recombination-promoting nuclease/putative transposase [Lachnospiraceae bacterium]|nr:Rpn family recombination-promoting nuclease/putative transposase [Lachnospiraceae bacterium]
MQRRKLEDLNLLDDFLFGSVVTYPGIGEAFSRELLEIIFERHFGKLKVVPQKVYYGSDTDRHGARLDVYLEEGKEQDWPDATEQGRADLSEQRLEKSFENQNITIYDVEPDRDDRKVSVKALPKRVRFYHAKIDAQSLEAGESYHSLKSVIIIMIMPYDPFGLDRMVYTIRSSCIEVPEMPYDDGAKTLFLYSRGKEGDPPEKLKQLLHYMEETTDSNASNDALREMHQMVKKVKQDREVSLGYMKIFEREEMLREEGLQQGFREGSIKSFVEACKEFNATQEDIRRRLQEKFSLSEKEAEDYLIKYW